MDSTFLLLLLLLIPSLNILFNAFNSLPTLISCLFFRATPWVLLSLLKALNLAAEACLSAFQQLAEALKWILVSTIEMGLGIISCFVVAVFEFVKNNVVFGWGFGGLLEKTKASWEGTVMEQVREIVETVSQLIVDMVWEKATSVTGSMFDFAKSVISELLNEPGSAIGGLMEKMKLLLEGSSSMEGVREIVGRFIEKVVGMGLGIGSSSAVSVFEVVKNVFGLAVESGLTVGGLLEKTKAALEVLRMEQLRGIIESVSKIIVNLVFSYFLG